MYDDKEYFEKVIDYRKHLDNIILSRTAIFCTLNSLLFFVFSRPDIPRLRLGAAFSFAIIFNMLWLIVSIRTRSSMKRSTEELSRIEKKQDKGNLLYNGVIVRTGSVRTIPATAILCDIVPTVFILAWVTFFYLGWYGR